MKCRLLDSKDKTAGFLLSYKFPGITNNNKVFNLTVKGISKVLYMLVLKLIFERKLLNNLFD